MKSANPPKAIADPVNHYSSTRINATASSILNITRIRVRNMQGTVESTTSFAGVNAIQALRRTAVALTFFMSSRIASQSYTIGFYLFTMLKENQLAFRFYNEHHVGSHTTGEIMDREICPDKKYGDYTGEGCRRLRLQLFTLPPTGRAPQPPAEGERRTWLPVPPPYYL